MTPRRWFVCIAVILAGCLSAAEKPEKMAIMSVGCMADHGATTKVWPKLTGRPADSITPKPLTCGSSWGTVDTWQKGQPVLDIDGSIDLMVIDGGTATVARVFIKMLRRSSVFLMPDTTWNMLREPVDKTCQIIILGSGKDDALLVSDSLPGGCFNGAPEKRPEQPDRPDRTPVFIADAGVTNFRVALKGEVVPDDATPAGAMAILHHRRNENIVLSACVAVLLLLLMAHACRWLRRKGRLVG